MRRCLYLYHIIKQNENSLMFKFFMAQLKKSKNGDWASQVLKDLEDFKINLELEEIQNLSLEKYKLIVKLGAINFAFEKLINKKKSTKSENVKGKNIIYIQLRMADYLNSENVDVTIEEKKWIFQCRVEDIEIKGNKRWKYDDISCKSCNSQQDETKMHILFCKNLMGSNELLTYIPDYQELFEGDLEGQNYVARLLRDNFIRRIV